MPITPMLGDRSIVTFSTAVSISEAISRRLAYSKDIFKIKCENEDECIKFVKQIRKPCQIDVQHLSEPC